MKEMRFDEARSSTSAGPTLATQISRAIRRSASSFSSEPTVAINSSISFLKEPPTASSSIGPHPSMCFDRWNAEYGLALPEEPLPVSTESVPDTATAESREVGSGDEMHSRREDRAVERTMR